MPLHYSPSTDTLSESPSPDSILIGDESRPRGTNSSFAPGTSFQFAWDSVSLGALKECPRKYYFSLVEGWTHSIKPPAMAFGIYYHKCLETWDKLRAEGMDKETALFRVVRLAGLLGELIPSGESTRTKETLVRAVVWYLDQFWDDPTETVTLANGKPAVEYSFALPFVEVNGVQTYLCGHIDRVATFQGGIYPFDRKTTKRQLDHKYFAQFKPHNQFSIYMSAVNILAEPGTALPEPADGIIVDAVQMGVNFSRFQRYPIYYTPEDIEEFLNETQLWLQTAALYAESGHWPANQESCDKYGGCPFREICTKPAGRREMYLRTYFTQQTWDPLVAR